MMHHVIRADRHLKPLSVEGTPACFPGSSSCSLLTSPAAKAIKNTFLFLCRDFSPALFNSAPILPSGSSMSNQLTSQLSSDSSPGQAPSLGLRPSHDPMLTSPPPSSTAKALEDKDGYKLTASSYLLTSLTRLSDYF